MDNTKELVTSTMDTRVRQSTHCSRFVSEWRTIALVIALTACGNPYILNGYKSPMGVNGLRSRGHTGIDFKGHRGDSALASAPGSVISTKQNALVGNAVLLGHVPTTSGTFKYYTVYLHLDSVTVATGDYVERGEAIGTIGATGRASGGVPHLHLQLCSFACTFGTADGDFEGVQNPLSFSAGCFDPRREYDETAITYPVRCGHATLVEDASDTTAQIERSYARHDWLVSDFTQTSVNRSLGTTSKSHGRLWSGPSLARWEYSEEENDRILLIRGDNGYWQVGNNWSKASLAGNANREALLILGSSSGLQAHATVAYDLRYSEGGDLLVRLTPVNDRGIKYTVVSISKTKKCVTGAVIVDRAGNEVRFRFTHQRLQDDVPEELLLQPDYDDVAQ